MAYMHKKVGIIGGGQLARMMALSAHNLGFEVVVWGKKSSDSASSVTGEFVAGDCERLTTEEVDRYSPIVLTIESENLPYKMLRELEEKHSVFPGWMAVYYAQNRLREKDFVKDLGIQTAYYIEISSFLQLEEETSKLGEYTILKTIENGYDGRGQYRIHRDVTEQDWEAICSECAISRFILEEKIDFDCEISVIVARNIHGQKIHYDIGTNIHRSGILSESLIPAELPVSISEQAIANSYKIADALNYVGVMAVEYFVVKDQLIFNEFAPRPHNSGHWTIDGSITSQFEQHIRAITGLPFGNTSRIYKKIKMKNIIGNEVKNAFTHLSDRNAKLHLYNKKHVSAGRKMGHINFLISS